MGRIVAQIKKLYRDCVAAWDRFWFTATDPTVLCLMRILVGGMLTYTVFVWGLKFDAFLGDNAWNSPKLLDQIQSLGFAPSFWWYVPEAARGAVHRLCLGVLVLFTIGLCTRVTSVLSMAILISYSYRAHLANYGLDQINALLTFYLCLAPCGARFSVDRLIRNRLGRTEPDTTEPSVSANLATRMMQLHFCMIYSFAGLAKLQGEGWWDGEAIWMALANSEYQTTDMTWIAWFPWVSDIATHTTILFELTFWALVWGRFRPLYLVVGAALHLGIGAMMGMWTFAFIMIFGHLSFWSPALVNQIIQRFRTKQSTEDDDDADDHEPPITLATAAAPATDAIALAPVRRLVCLDPNQAARLRCIAYFSSRDYECYGTGDIEEASRLCDALEPTAVIVVGDAIDDEPLICFHQQHTFVAPTTMAFYILNDTRNQSLGNALVTRTTSVISDTQSLGNIRRIIERATVQVAQPVAVATRTQLPAHNDLPEDDGSCNSAIPNKPR